MVLNSPLLVVISFHKPVKNNFLYTKNIYKKILYYILEVLPIFRLTLTCCGVLNAYKIASAMSLDFKNKHAFNASIPICSVISV